jgi:murein DD-endopeptidase MepM/ murein hydrolase activator NlpD
MNRPISLALTALMAASTVMAATHPCSISCQGLILPAARGTAGGACAIDIVPLGGTAEPLSFLVTVTGSDGASHVLRLRGEAFMASSLGLVVAVERPETDALPATVRAFNLEGREVWSRQVRGLSSPTLSQDGSHLAFRSIDVTTVIDLATFDEESYPRLSPFALGPAGRIAGVATCEDARAPQARTEAFELLVDDGGSVRSLAVTDRPERVAFAPDGSSVLLLSKRALAKVGPSDETPETLFSAPPGAELRDLRTVLGAICVGLRRVEGETFTGQLAVLEPDGALREITNGPSREIERSVDVRGRDGEIPWPLAPNEQHEVGNTYGEYQNYGGSPYLHPGVDVMGSPGQPAYAVADGVVKAVLTTSGDWHWRVATADSATAELCTGYLYAHLDLPTIAVSVGDAVTQGQYLGDLVEWTTSEFHHVHFARIEDSGLQWYGDWLTTDNLHTDFVNQTESVAPAFEPARGSDLLAFCANESSEYQSATALSGEVDIIAHVGDTIESTWVCSVQEIRYTIYPLGLPQFPVVPDKLAVRFDMALDTYSGGPIDPFLVDLLYKQDNTCRTRGDYSFREFYHIITNSNGDETYDESDVSEAWDTTVLPDADYVVRVTAADAAGNATADSMVVTTANGNPTSIAPFETGRATLHSPFPNPSRCGTAIAFSLPSEARAAVRVYAPSGRFVSTVVDREFPAGTSVATWDGRDSSGKLAASGVYFIRLEVAGESSGRKLIVTR